ncbi:MAG TPA: hypothetical protein VK638_17045, partial [Edaphobacter sp.]|nr:hypothetical protein [Edaphobacter sp.]
ANLISAGLFGDGAAAVIIAGEDTPLPGVKIVGTRSTFYPNTEDAMGWDISEKGFSIVLSAGVPQIIREHLRRDMDEFWQITVSLDRTSRAGSSIPWSQGPPGREVCT